MIVPVGNRCTYFYERIKKTAVLLAQLGQVILETDSDGVSYQEEAVSWPKKALWFLIGIVLRIVPRIFPRISLGITLPVLAKDPVGREAKASKSEQKRVEEVFALVHHNPRVSFNLLRIKCDVQQTVEAALPLAIKATTIQG
jgi:hypothetical protein